MKLSKRKLSTQLQRDARTAPGARLLVPYTSGLPRLEEDAGLRAHGRAAPSALKGRTRVALCSGSAAATRHFATMTARRILASLRRWRRSLRAPAASTRR